MASRLESDSQERQRVSADLQRVEALWISDARHRDLARVPGADGLEGLLVFPIREIGGRAMIDSGAVRRVVPQGDQSFGLGERQGLQQDAVDDAEDRRRGANPERKGQNGRRGESGRLRKDAHGVAHVLPEIMEQVPGRRSRCDRGLWMRLTQRTNVLRQDVARAEIGQRQAYRVGRQGAAGGQLAITVFQMLRKLIDDFGLARWREPQGRQSGANLASPDGLAFCIAWRGDLIRHVRLR